jgi:hypothetical protein
MVSSEVQHEKKQGIRINLIHIPDTECSSSESFFASLPDLALLKLY